MSVKKINIPEFYSDAQIRAETFDEKSNTIDVIWSTGERGLRTSFFDGQYYEELAMNPENVRLARFQSGKAPVLNSHSQYDLNSVIGVVESAEIRDGKGLAKVRLSKREDIQPIVQDIRDGIIRNISFGYKVYRYEIIEDVDTELKIYRATDFEPMELSFVPVPFDSGAETRAANSASVHECEILTREDSMNEEAKTEEAPKAEEVKTEEAPKAEEVKTEEAAPVAEEVKTEEPAPAAEGQTTAGEIEKRAVAIERKRVSEIVEVVRKANLDREIADKFIEKGLSVDAARKEVLDMISKETNSGETRSAHVEMGQDLSRDARIEGMSEAILYRSDSINHKLSEKSNQYRHHELIDNAKDCLRANGFSDLQIRGMSKTDIVDRAFHSTSDFPLILENVVNKRLREGYTMAPQTFLPFVRQRPVNDFKQISSLQAGMGPQLLEVQEGGELQAGTIDEGAEKGSIKSYGRKIKVTRKLIINDDVGFLTDVPFKMGQQRANLEANLFWIDLILANPLMSDSNPLFSVAHGNLAGAGAKPDVTTISAGRQAMLEQKDLDGVTPIVVMPEYIVVSPEDLTVAEQYTTVLQGNVYSPTTGANQNPFLGKLKPIVEPRLAGTTPTWYLMASASMIPMVEWLVLSGQEGGPISSQYFDNDTKGVTFDILYDVAFLPVDFRGMYKNPGA